MPSTTIERYCEFCGRQLGGRTRSGFVIPSPCDCDGAVEARERRIQEELAEEEAQRVQKVDKRLLNSGIRPRYLKAEHDMAERLAKRVKEGSSLYIVGSLGTGKTHLASAICRKLTEGGKRFRFVTGIDLLMELQASFSSTKSESEVLERFTRMDVLVLDDLGKEPPTEWALSRLFAIVNARYDAMAPVIFTTNYEKSQLVERLGKHGDTATAEAIVSRLCQMCETVKLSGRDRRLS